MTRFIVALVMLFAFGSVANAAHRHHHHKAAVQHKVDRAPAYQAPQSSEESKWKMNGGK
jgi:hypothetical protein